MQLDKRDLLTIAVLAIIFFSVATWNLGFTQTPTTTWKTTKNASIYVDFGSSQNIGTAYFLVKYIPPYENTNISGFTGSLGNWTDSGKVNILASYYSWNSLNIERNVQYVRFDFQPQTSVEIAEIAFLNSDNQLITIGNIAQENGSDANLPKLIDEQSLVHLPPTYMSQTYFDEIYFVQTAEQYLHLQSPYEWTHPPLGKLIQAAGIIAFGFDPFGWRIMGVLFATLMIPVMYLLGKKLFGTWIGAFSSAFLLTFDFMHFTMGRMGTADTYVVFFSLLSQLFFLICFLDVIKKGWKTSVLPLFLAVIFFVLGFSTKWLVLYGAVGMLMLLAALRIKDVSKLKEGLGRKYAAFFDHPFLLLLGFIGVAVGIYFLIYIPDMLTGRPFFGTNGVIDLQFAMYHYHSTLVATHPFASPWWSWPFIVSPTGYVPLWLSASSLPNGVRSSISVFGNPAVWWVGFACIIAAAERAIRAKDLAATFITTVFFFSWIPYVFISRVTFIYHFYVSVPFLCLASAYFINKYWNTKMGKIITIAYFAIVVAMFVLFFNVISGVPAPSSWIDRLKLFPSWFF
jgi:dolichyl-phosphate-mannose-protein mannosyltransferase